jgi:hypothetical protein
LDQYSLRFDANKKLMLTYKYSKGDKARFP